MNNNENYDRKSFVNNQPNTTDGIISNEAVNEMISPSRNIEIEEESFSLAIVGGLLASMICIFLWATITVLTKYQIAYMAIGVGFAVGYAIQRFGKGRGIKYGILGAVVSLLTCMLGNLFSYVYFISESYDDYPFMEALSNLSIQSSWELLFNYSDLMDLGFYAAALYCGFIFARKTDD